MHKRTNTIIDKFNEHSLIDDNCFDKAIIINEIMVVTAIRKTKYDVYDGVRLSNGQRGQRGEFKFSKLKNCGGPSRDFRLADL